MNRGSLFPWRRDRPFLAILIAVFLLNGGMWGLLLWRIDPTGELVPIHYTIYFGIDRLGNWRQLFLVPLSGTVIGIVNTVIATLVYRRERVLAYLMEIAALLAQIILSIATLFLIILNIS